MPVKKVESGLDEKAVKKTEIDEKELVKLSVDSKKEDMVMVQKVEGKKEESLIQSLVVELKEHPERAVAFIQVLSKITKPWESIGPDGATASVNEVTVPQGTSAQAYQKQSWGGPNISAFKLTTIFGDDVALIIKDSPKWRITIEGVPQIDGPFVQHGQKAEQTVKQFVEERLAQRGYIIG